MVLLGSLPSIDPAHRVFSSAISAKVNVRISPTQKLLSAYEAEQIQCQRWLPYYL